MAQASRLCLPLLLLAAVSGALPGCAGAPQIRQGPVYPAQLPRTGTLDIHVIRRGKRIEMTNTTARSFGESTLWLNQRFGFVIKEGLAIGETRTLNLKEFRDNFDDRFRGGGFFATEKPEKIVLAELQPGEGEQLLSLVVVAGPEEP